MTKIVCSGEILKQALTKVLTCVNPREIRIALTGVFSDGAVKISL